MGGAKRCKIEEEEEEEEEEAKHLIFEEFYKLEEMIPFADRYNLVKSTASTEPCKRTFISSHTMTLKKFAPDL